MLVEFALHFGCKLGSPTPPATGSFTLPTIVPYMVRLIADGVLLKNEIKTIFPEPENGGVFTLADSFKI